MEVYVAVAVLTALVFGGIYLLTKYPSARNHLPTIKKIITLLRITFEHWGLKKAYSETALLGLQFVELLEDVHLEGENPRESRRRVSNFVASLFAALYPEGLEREKARATAAASYMALLHHQDILQTVRELKDHPNLDVRRATLVAIDTLGELFNLKDELSREYYQHLIYGINKCLILFRDGGKDLKNLKKIYAVLWRTYKLTKAFNSLRRDKGLTKEEFYGKMAVILDAMSRVLGSR